MSFETASSTKDQLMDQGFGCLPSSNNCLEHRGLLICSHGGRLVLMLLTPFPNLCIYDNTKHKYGFLLCVFFLFNITEKIGLVS